MSQPADSSAVDLLERYQNLVWKISHSFAENDADLDQLNLGITKLDDAGAIELGVSLVGNTNLLYLQLDNNSVGWSGAKSIADGLRGNKALHTLRLPYNSVGAAGATALGEVLNETAITYLNLNWNSIEDGGAEALGAGLKGNSTLKTLDLVFNRIGPVGGVALAEGMRSAGCTGCTDGGRNRALKIISPMYVFEFFGLLFLRRK